MSISCLLKKYNIRPKKGLGQNFLVEEPTIDKIIRTLSPSGNDKILEVGPGLGVMTKKLSLVSKFVAAVETDKEMINILENELGQAENIHIIHGDILDTNLDKLVRGPGVNPSKEKWLFVGNIPYNITSTLLFHIRKYRHLFDRGVITIQKEVAARLVAVPCCKDYGILSVGLQAVADIKRCFNISPESFFPRPGVDSSVIEIKFPNRPKFDIVDIDFFSSVVRAAFSTRRKKIKNAMEQSSLIDVEKEVLLEAFKKAEISPDSRAEEVEIKKFVNLANILFKGGL